MPQLNNKQAKQVLDEYSKLANSIESNLVNPPQDFKDIIYQLRCLIEECIEAASIKIMIADWDLKELTDYCRDEFGFIPTCITEDFNY